MLRPGLTSSLYRHAILDRDGVINREAPGGWLLDMRDFAWESGAVKGLRLLSRAGVRISIATNQSCIGRGLADLQTISAVNASIVERALVAGVHVDGIFVCPHIDAQGCSCRKPAPGLLLAAMQRSNFAREQTVMIGDSARDLAAADAAGIDSVLVRTGNGASTERSLSTARARAVDDLYAAACLITGRY